MLSKLCTHQSISSDFKFQLKFPTCLIDDVELTSNLLIIIENMIREHSFVTLRFVLQFKFVAFNYGMPPIGNDYLPDFGLRFRGHTMKTVLSWLLVHNGQLSCKLNVINGILRCVFERHAAIKHVQTFDMGLAPRILHGRPQTFFQGSAIYSGGRQYDINCLKFKTLKIYYFFLKSHRPY